MKKYFRLVVEEEDFETSLMDTKVYEMTAALSILNILLENGCDKSELSGKCSFKSINLFVFVYSVIMYLIKSRVHRNAKNSAASKE